MADFTQEQLAALNRSIASGELSVRYGDTSVTYRTIDELIRARDLVQNALNGAASAGQKSYTVAGFSRG